ncbi:hypothetical protein VPH35_035138 [Triticum aestivum]
MFLVQRTVSLLPYCQCRATASSLFSFILVRVLSCAYAYFVVTDREYTFGYQSLHNRPTIFLLNVHCPTGYNAHTLSLVLPTTYCCGAAGTKLSSSRTSCTCTCSSKEL